MSAGGSAALLARGLLALASGALLAGAPGRAAAARSGDPSPASCSQVAYGSPAGAADSGSVSPLLPPNPSGPTLVGIGIQVREISDIAPVKDEYAFRGYVRASWCDPRLAFDAEAEGSDIRIHTGKQASQLAETIWIPAAFPVNDVGGVEVSDRVFRIHSDGSVEQDVNVGMRLRTHYDLRDFPFDRQTLELQIESFAWHRGRLVLVEDATRSGVDPDLRIPEWRLESIGGRVEEVEALRSDQPFSRFVLSIGIARNPGFYLWKVFLPLTVIVAISWSIFWMPDERLASRSRITSTGVLTIVAYQFVFAGDLPRIGYLTLLDKIMIVSFSLLAITILQSMLVDQFQERDKAVARRIDRISRWVFPTVYAGLLIGFIGLH